MPMYEYECMKCGERFEVIQKFSDTPIKLHSENNGRGCNGAVKKLLSAPAIQFKGSGWYVTDYGKGSQKPEAQANKTKKNAKPDTANKSGSDSASKSGSSSNGSRAAAPASSKSRS